MAIETPSIFRFCKKKRKRCDLHCITCSLCMQSDEKVTMYQMGCTIDVSLVCINFLIKLHSENQDYWSLLFLKETRQTTLQLFTFWGREAPPTMQSDVGVGRPLQACKVMVYKVMKLKLNGPSPSMTYFLKTFFIRRR